MGDPFNPNGGFTLSTPYCFVFHWPAKPEGKRFKLPEEDTEAEAHLVPQIIEGLQSKTKKCTLVFLFKERFYLNGREAIKLYLLLKEHPLVISQYVSEDGLVLYVMGVQGREIKCILPFGHGKFHKEHKETTSPTYHPLVRQGDRRSSVGAVAPFDERLTDAAHEPPQSKTRKKKSGRGSISPIVLEELAIKQASRQPDSTRSSESGQSQYTFVSVANDAVP